MNQLFISTEVKWRYSILVHLTTVLYCTVLYYTVLYCTILNCNWTQCINQEAGWDWQEEGRGQSQAWGPGRWQEGQEGFYDPREEEETQGINNKRSLKEFSQNVHVYFSFFWEKRLPKNWRKSRRERLLREGRSLMRDVDSPKILTTPLKVRLTTQCASGPRRPVVGHI